MQTFIRELAARNEVAARIPYALFATAVVCLTLVARAALYPPLIYDDNSLHLGMWTQLDFRHYYTFDYITQIWSVMPRLSPTSFPFP